MQNKLITVRNLLTGLITLDYAVKELQLNNKQIKYITQEIDNYKFGESSLEDTVERIKLFLT